MPVNQFPDTPEKRALRRRDRRLLEQYAKHVDRPLSYCGMPSVEYLDVEAWKDVIGSVTAVELDPDVANDMRIERDLRRFPFPVEVVRSDVLEFLPRVAQPFDLYNLDFYTGFINLRGKRGKKSPYAPSIEALKALFATQRTHRQSFVLITTFNVRDRGADQYLQFLDGAKQELGGRPNGIHNLEEHSQNQARRMKICFPFFCWQQAELAGFAQHCDNIFVYSSSATLVHFHQRFHFRETGVLHAPSTTALVAIANMPLFEMRGEIPHRNFVPTEIGA